MISVVDYVTTLVKEECQKNSNVYGYEIWTHHIKYVVSFARMLAGKLGGDLEIVELAAVLHDIAKIRNFQNEDNHHVIGAQEAELILREIAYPPEKIAQVKACILSHRIKTITGGLSTEEVCVASADGMAHIQQIWPMLYYMYTKRGLSLDQGLTWVRNKIIRSWAKLCPEAQELMRGKYLCLQVALGIEEVGGGS